MISCATIYFIICLWNCFVIGQWLLLCDKILQTTLSGHTHCIPTNRVFRVLFSPQPHQHLFVDLVMMAILTGVKCYLIVVLICTPLIASDTEHPLIITNANFIYFLLKCFIILFYKLWYFVFIYNSQNIPPFVFPSLYLIGAEEYRG